jgi:hypothetical protein
VLLYPSFLVCVFLEKKPAVLSISFVSLTQQPQYDVDNLNRVVEAALELDAGDGRLLRVVKDLGWNEVLFGRRRIRKHI